MFKAEQFNNLLNEVHKKEEEKKKVKKQKQQEIQLQMKLVEDSLNDMENKFKQAVEKGTEYPKFALVKFSLFDEVKKELIMNQGYLLDESFGQTKIFYNKELFEEYRKNTKQKSNVKNKEYSNIPKFNYDVKQLDEMGGSIETNNFKKEDLNISYDNDEVDDNIIKLFKSLFGDDAKITYYRGGF